MIRLKIRDLGEWEILSAPGETPLRYTLPIANGCEPIARSIWAELTAPAKGQAEPLWSARLCLASPRTGEVRFLCSDAGESDFQGPSFRAVAREVELAFEALVDDLAGAVHRLEALLDAPILTVSEVADEMRTPRNTVLHWIKTGRLRAFRIGKKWQVRREDLKDALERSSPGLDS